MDYRKLIPRTPPEGLEEWVGKTCREALDRYGLVYEAEYAEDYGLLQVLDEWAKPRKVKVVRATCSCCGESIHLNWAKVEAHGYGFILPEDEEGDWAHTVTTAGDKVDCPMCGEKVLVNKRAAVKNYYVTAECGVMSAQLLDSGELVLTCWWIQRCATKSGLDRIYIQPAEAYVFTATDCVQLMGWRNGYSGASGYYIEFGHSWRQPKGWHERWGQEDHIFGLTPELIDRSCLPHCKLDVYMAQRPGAMHYPVAWLRLYQAQPNVEAVLLHGLPRVLDNLIAAETEANDWCEKNVKGLVELPQIDWAQTRPAQMLGLTKEELRMARKQGWNRYFWDMFVAAKRSGELLTEEDIRDAFRLGDEHLMELVPRGQVGKSIRYLLRQCTSLREEVDAEDADEIPDALILRDYWDMSEALGRDLSEPSVKYPADLIEAHDRAENLMTVKAEDARAARFRVRRRVLKQYAFAAHGLLIRPATSQRELTAEGDALHHCVGIYGERHANGQTAIFFIRRKSCLGKPYFTLELDEKKLTVRQNRGLRNCDPPEEVREFVAEWLKWARSGAPKARKTKQKAEAA